MQPPLIVVPIAIEWLLIASSVAPTLRGKFNARPNLGIAVWFALFLSVLVAALIGFAVSVWAIFVGWADSGISDFPLAIQLLAGAGPWIIMILAGVLISLINRKLEPIIETNRKFAESPLLRGRSVKSFHGLEVESIDLPLWFSVFLKNPTPRILLSSQALAGLSADQLEAVLWHEYAHYRLRHNSIKGLVGLLATITSFVRVSRVMKYEVDLLCEIAADDFAAKRVPRETLSEARALFL